MLDLIVFGGTCVLPGATTLADIGVKEGASRGRRTGTLADASVASTPPASW